MLWPRRHPNVFMESKTDTQKKPISSGDPKSLEIVQQFYRTLFCFLVYGQESTQFLGFPLNPRHLNPNEQLELELILMI